ncbi:putative 5,10-methylenetetrahydrofolate reductase [Candidatus Tremblaya phenacola PAVE]|nr:putative 5,10-methylenetetrahydrofolate reductase [Candidatus Tremblaya phenacola PAVE]
MVSQKKLSSLRPRFVSITSGNCNFKEHFDVVIGSNKFFRDVAPHLLCSTEGYKMLDTLGSFLRAPTAHLMILRGDISPPDVTIKQPVSKMVEMIRAGWGGTFLIDVSNYPDPHPQSLSERSDNTIFSSKIIGGADSSVTQYSYNLNSFLNKILELWELGIRIPITAGVLTTNNSKQLKRMAKVCGSEIPLWFVRRAEDLEANNKPTSHLFTETTIQLCEVLKDCGIQDLHFYTLNDHRPVTKICHSIGFGPTPNLIQ